MISKETFTKIFLQQKDKSTDSANMKHHMYKWWQSHRSKDIGGLRLSEEGFDYLVNELELRSYEIPFTEPIDLSPQTIIFFDRTMDFRDDIKQDKNLNSQDKERLLKKYDSVLKELAMPIMLVSGIK